MTTHPSSATVQPRWLIIVGGATLLITALAPLLVGRVFSNLLGDWTINNLLSSFSLSEATNILLDACLVLPVLLSLFSVSLWKRMVKTNKPLTAWRGLCTFLLADMLAGISGFLLSLICVLLLAPICGFLPAMTCNGESLGFFWLALWAIVVVQTLYSLPFLLIAGALIAQWQAHSRRSVSI